MTFRVALLQQNPATELIWSSQPVRLFYGLIDVLRMPWKSHPNRNQRVAIFISEMRSSAACLVYLVWVARGISPEWSWNPSENVDDHVKCESDASNNYFQSTKDGTGTNLHRRSGRFEVLRTRIWTKAANKNTLWLVVWLMSKSIKRRVVRQYYNGRTEESPEQVVGG